MATAKVKGSSPSMQNLPLVGKVAIGVVLALLVGAGYFIVFYGEVEDQITAQQQKYDSLGAELEKAKQAREAFNQDLAELKRREQLVNKQKTILPDEAESPAFLSSLQTVATVSGIELTSWSPQDEVNENFYARIPMELTLTGKYHQIARFFHGVGQADRIINMENISIQLDPQAARPVPIRPGAINLDETTSVNVKCLATAFRALTADDPARKRKDAKGAQGGRK